MIFDYYLSIIFSILFIIIAVYYQIKSETKYSTIVIEKKASIFSFLALISLLTESVLANYLNRNIFPLKICITLMFLLLIVRILSLLYHLKVAKEEL